MFVADYKHDFSDHAKVLILVKNFEPLCEHALFDRTFAAITSHHSTVCLKNAVQSSIRTRRSPSYPTKPSGSLLDLSNRHGASTDVACSNSSSRERVLCLRYTRDYHSVNQTWSAFQAHRAILGLIGMCCCSTKAQIIGVIQDYVKQKALLSDQSCSGRLLILVAAQGSGDTLTMEEACMLIEDESTKLPQSLLLSTDEVLAHPLEQIFNTDMLVIQQRAIREAATEEEAPIPVANMQTDLKAMANRRQAVVAAPMLNPRLTVALVDMASKIYNDLELLVATGDPKSKHAKRNSSAAFGTNASTGGDHSDGESSESGLSIGTAPPDMRIGEVTELSAKERVYSSKPYITYFENPTLNALQSDMSVGKQRRYSGRWKKHLADVALQLGELDLAQLYYETAVQLLRPLLDNLWVASALEGLCAVAVVRRSNIFQVSDSMLLVGRPRLTNGTQDKLAASGTDNPEIPTRRAASITPINSSELSSTALEALELYKKVQIDKAILEETSFKIARLLVTEKQSTKACDLLNFLFLGTLDEDGDEPLNKPKRLGTLINLFRNLSFERRASLIAWETLQLNIKLTDANEFQALFSGLNIEAYSPVLVFTDALEPSLMLSPVVTAAQGCSCLARPAVPICLRPSVKAYTSVWSHANTRAVRSYAHKQKRQNAAEQRRSGRQRGSHKSTIDDLLFQNLGWPSLQAASVWFVIQRYKEDVRFDDAADIQWEKGLQLIGCIFSLLDAWPEQLKEDQCNTIMEDLCRLAVFRCPDQPLSTSTLFRFKSDMSGNLDRPYWLQSSQQSNSAMSDKANDVASPAMLRQLVDLIEVHVHRLPAIQNIHLLALPDHLVPCDLSSDAITSAVPLSPRNQFSLDPDVSTPNCDISVPIARDKLSPKKSTALFFHIPNDVSGANRIPVIDWVCEEPVEIELMVNNQLPVELRISEMRIELIPLSNHAPSMTKSTERHGTAAAAAAAGMQRNASGSAASVVQLEVKRIFVEKSQNKRPPQPYFSVELNKDCLIETAEFRNAHPRSKLDPAWRRQASRSMSCTLPACTSGIRMICSVIPTADMIAPILIPDEVNSQSMYRLSGITYRLVDFGGIYVCVRAPPSQLLEFVRQHSNDAPGSASVVHERRLSNSSSSSSSMFSVMRSSLNSGLDALLPSTIGPTEPVPDHPVAILTRSLFAHLPAIRLHSPMPRLCLLPGLVRSARSLKEATEFLPELTIPCSRDGRHGSIINRSYAKHIQPPRFRPVMDETWSSNVVTVSDISLYPYETRWLPLRLFMRDEGYVNESMAQGNCLRQLNLLHTTLKVSENTDELLKKVGLPIEKLVQLHGSADIAKKLPLSICNSDVRTRLSVPHKLSLGNNTESDRSSVLSLEANDCGLLWLSLHADAFWHCLLDKMATGMASDTSDSSLSLLSSKKLLVEFTIEYALDVPVVEAEMRSSFIIPPGRRVTLGLALSLLASKHTPMSLFYPKLTFRDEPRTSADAAPPLSPIGDFRSKTLFYCTLHARLPISLIPRPVRYTNRQYRAQMKLYARWTGVTKGSDDPSDSSSVAKMHTDWTTLSEPGSRQQRRSRRRTDVAGLIASEAPSDSASSLTGDSELPEVEERTVEMKSPMRKEEWMDETNESDDEADGNSSPNQQQQQLYSHICLPLDSLSELLLTREQMQCVNESDWSADEIGLPLPTSTMSMIHKMEQNIAICWESRLYGRLARSHESLGEAASVAKEDILPDPRFYRFGRFLLGAFCEDWPSDPGNSISSTIEYGASYSMDTRSNFMAQPWYGRAFSSPAAIAGWFWCHNIRVDVDIPQPGPSSRGKSTESPCSNCGGDKVQNDSEVKRAPPEPHTRYSVNPNLFRRVSEPFTKKGVKHRLMRNKRASILGQLAENESSSPYSNKSLSLYGRRLSVPDLRNPNELKGLASDELESVRATCIKLMCPLTIMVRSWCAYHPLKGIRFTDKLTTDASDRAVQIHRLWTRLVVYEMVDKLTDSTEGKEDGAESKGAPELSAPLAEGKDYCLIGHGSGTIGLTLQTGLSDCMEYYSSIVFFRPGRFWICGLLALLSPKFPLPTLQDSDPIGFTPPSLKDLDTVRFSPNGITVHVSQDSSDTSTRLDIVEPL